MKRMVDCQDCGFCAPEGEGHRCRGIWKNGVDMKIRNINCIFYTDFGKCNHLDRGRGFLGIGKRCVLIDDFPSECGKRIRQQKPKEPPMPPCKPPKKR